MRAMEEVTTACSDVAHATACVVEQGSYSWSFLLFSFLLLVAILALAAKVWMVLADLQHRMR